MTFKTYKLSDMKKGWFVGNFFPTIHNTNNVEVAIKKYNAGDKEGKHYHKLATEITVITKGEVEMNGNKYKEGSIIVIEPFTATDFHALSDVTTTVVKIPGANDDKYEGEP
tara:strand:- start:57 stop:389 length:333 start_codon:yes stop_codon:yes gene_type:complete